MSSQSLQFVLALDFSCSHLPCMTFLADETILLEVIRRGRCWGMWSSTNYRRSGTNSASRNALLVFQMSIRFNAYVKHGELNCWPFVYTAGCLHCSTPNLSICTLLDTNYPTLRPAVPGVLWIHYYNNIVDFYRLRLGKPFCAASNRWKVVL